MDIKYNFYPLQITSGWVILMIKIIYMGQNKFHIIHIFVRTETIKTP